MFEKKLMSTLGLIFTRMFEHAAHAHHMTAQQQALELVMSAALRPRVVKMPSPCR
jgi:hypothetical protein